MQGTNISLQERQSRLMNEFNKFVAMEGESLTSVYERFTTLINIMDQNGVIPQEISINTKLLNSLQPEWTKYVTMTRQTYIEEYDHNVQRVPRIESTPRKINVQCCNYNGKGHNARDCPKPRVHDAKYFRERMLLETKDKVGVHLDEEEKDCMLDKAYGDNTLEELSASMIMMARIQPVDDMSDAKTKYDAEVISEVNASQINLIIGLLSKGVHEQKNHKKLKTVIHTSADDQIDSDIIFDDPYVEDNGGK
ncbi:retrovirus-related pol polyprotein from transposon TNT 1-94 [Tanacetum coccineum]